MRDAALLVDRPVVVGELHLVVGRHSHCAIVIDVRDQAWRPGEEILGIEVEDRRERDRPRFAIDMDIAVLADELASRRVEFAVQPIGVKVVWGSLGQLTLMQLSAKCTRGTPIGRMTSFSRL